MKNFIKLVGIIAMAAVIGFGFIACGDSGGETTYSLRVSSLENSDWTVGREQIRGCSGQTPAQGIATINATDFTQTEFNGLWEGIGDDTDGFSSPRQTETQLRNLFSGYMNETEINAIIDKLQQNRFVVFASGNNLEPNDVMILGAIKKD
jgi:hypothetical protein